MKHHRFLLFFVFLILLQGQINAQIEINQVDEMPVFAPNRDSASNYQNIVVITYPGGAHFTANKRYLGITPLEAKLSFGINEFYITKPGYKVFQNIFNISKESGKFEIHLTQENSLSADSGVILSEDPSIDLTPYPPNYQVPDYKNLNTIHLPTLLAEFEKAKKIKKVSYLVSLGCIAGATITGLIANNKYNDYTNAVENVNHLHDQIVFLDNIRNGLITVGVSFLIIGFGNEIKCHRLNKRINRLSGSVFILPEGDVLYATIRFDI